MEKEQMLRMAAQGGNLDAIKYDLKQTPLFDAAAWGTDELVAMLIE